MVLLRYEDFLERLRARERGNASKGISYTKPLKKPFDDLTLGAPTTTTTNEHVCFRRTDPRLFHYRH